MTAVKECRVCQTIHHPDDTECIVCHNRFSLMMVEHADYVICGYCGAPARIEVGVCPNPACQAPLPSLATTDILADIYTRLLGSNNIAEQIQRNGDHLLFVHEDLEWKIYLEYPHQLDVLVRYSSGQNLSPLPRNMFGGVVDRPAFLATANSLNAQFGFVKIFLGDRNDVWFRYCSPLFCQISEQAEEGKLGLAEVEPIVRIVLAALLVTIKQFFATVGRACDRDGKPSPISARKWTKIDPIPEALSILGLKPFHSTYNNNGKTEMSLFLGDFFALLRSDAVSFSLSLPFLEEGRFVPKATVANVIHGVVDERFYEIGNRFNQSCATGKTFAYVQDGSVHLTIDGYLPVANAKQIAHTLNYLFNRINALRETLFENLEITTSGFRSRLNVSS